MYGQRLSMVFQARGDLQDGGPSKKTRTVQTCFSNLPTRPIHVGQTQEDSTCQHLLKEKLNQGQGNTKNHVEWNGVVMFKLFEWLWNASQGITTYQFLAKRSHCGIIE